MTSVKETLSAELKSSCKCSFSSEYLILYEPHCHSANNEMLILWGRIVGMGSTDSVSFINLLTQWSNGGSSIDIEGISVTTIKACPVELNNEESPYCEM